MRCPHRPQQRPGRLVAGADRGCADPQRGSQRRAPARTARARDRAIRRRDHLRRRQRRQHPRGYCPRRRELSGAGALAPPAAGRAQGRPRQRRRRRCAPRPRRVGAGDGRRSPASAGVSRQLVSSWATRLAKSAFPRRLAMVSDPLSGMFAFRAAAVDLHRLNPVGFKVLLEILVRHPRARVAEVSYEFAPRHAGQSKASLRQGVSYLRHLARLRRVRLVKQLREAPASREARIRQTLRMLAFGLIGATGVVVNTAVLWFFYRTVGWNHLVGASLATQASTTWNFVLVDTLVYRKASNGTRAGRAGRFFVMNNLLLLARLPVLEALVKLGAGVLIANGITLIMLFLVRFIVSDRAIFASAAQEKGRDPVRVIVDLSAGEIAGGGDRAAGASSGRKRSRYLPYRYDIGGVVTVGSQIMLPELEFFRAQWISDEDVDIAVRVGDVGRNRPRRRAAMTEYTDPTVIRYEEHLGRIGANFRAQLGDRITVEVGPLLARSPHVVYTNIAGGSSPTT